MYCNIDEAFGGNSTYIKNILDNELNNEKLLDKYKNFDTYFEKPKIVEHFDNHPSMNHMVDCNSIVDHVIRCSECRKMIFKKYYNNIMNGNFKDVNVKKIVTIVLIVLLAIIGLKILWKL
jgi:hypothetical protein